MDALPLAVTKRCAKRAGGPVSVRSEPRFAERLWGRRSTCRHDRRRSHYSSSETGQAGNGARTGRGSPRAVAVRGRNPDVQGVDGRRGPERRPLLRAARGRGGAGESPGVGGVRALPGRAAGPARRRTGDGHGRRRRAGRGGPLGRRDGHAGRALTGTGSEGECRQASWSAGRGGGETGEWTTRMAAGGEDVVSHAVVPEPKEVHRHRERFEVVGGTS